MATIPIADITNATTTEDGTGIFDVLLKTTMLHIEDQVDKNNLTQSQLGEIYVAAIQSAMTNAIQFALQRGVAEAQSDLYERQKIGFDDDAKQKLLKTLLDTWSVAYSTSPLEDAIPDAIGIHNLDKLTENAMVALGVESVVNMANDNAIDGAY